ARVWNAVTGESIATLQAGGHIRSAKFAADNTHVATAAEDSARIWDLRAKPPNGKALWREGTTAVTLSPDGKNVAAPGADLLVHVFTVRGAGVRDLRGPSMRINSASFSPNNERIVAASDDGSAYVWSINNPLPEAVLEGHAGKVVDANFSRDGSRIVTTGAQT